MPFVILRHRDYDYEGVDSQPVLVVQTKRQANKVIGILTEQLADFQKAYEATDDFYSKLHPGSGTGKAYTKWATDREAAVSKIAKDLRMLDEDYFNLTTDVPIRYDAVVVPEWKSK